MSLTKNQQFQLITSIMIILCSITLGVETYFTERVLFLEILDWIFAIYFILEIGIRLFTADSVFYFFKFFEIKIDEASQRKKIQFIEEGIWNWFDLTIVVFSSISLFAHLFEHPEFLVVSRLFRVFRIMRLLEVSQELKNVEMKIVSIIPTVFSFALLLGVLIYIYAIIGIFLFSHQKYQNADFSSLQGSFLTLFQLMTLEGWVDIMYQASSLNSDSWFVRGYFISFIILTVIVSFNVFVAVLTSQVQEKISAEHQKEDFDLMKNLENQFNGNQQKLQYQITELLEEIKKLHTEIQNLKEKR